MPGRGPVLRVRQPGSVPPDGLPVRGPARPGLPDKFPRPRASGGAGPLPRPPGAVDRRAGPARRTKRQITWSSALFSAKAPVRSGHLPGHHRTARRGGARGQPGTSRRGGGGRRGSPADAPRPGPGRAGGHQRRRRRPGPGRRRKQGHPLRRPGRHAARLRVRDHGLLRVRCPGAQHRTALSRRRVPTGGSCSARTRSSIR